MTTNKKFSEAVEKAFGIAEKRRVEADNKPNSTSHGAPLGYHFCDAVGCVGIALERRLSRVIDDLNDKESILALMDITNKDIYFKQPFSIVQCAENGKVTCSDVFTLAHDIAEEKCFLLYGKDLTWSDEEYDAAYTEALAIIKAEMAEANLEIKN
ncbi:hypothetical protein L6019_RS23445 [Escherichia coli]|nr:hypothetical protein [Escherichia coli]EKG7113508.1 hypothetical protein [Escherichia coli]ELM8776654.1 hypothetical protein [Escherichia coli]EMA4402839.1 hypothetical protein [Escherichia coli]HAH8501014.1 hypothetical protein [Escherichia coli]